MTQQVDRPTFDIVWHAVETSSTNTAVEVAYQHGVRPPSDAPGWEIVMYYSPDGKQDLVWDRALRVVIDPEGFAYEGPLPGPDAMQVEQTVYNRIWAAAQDLDDADAIAEAVRAAGVEPPDDAPGWEVYVDSVTGREAERLVWYREETVPIQPVDRMVA